jgi:carbamoyl-phosphate synthase large subunit
MNILITSAGRRVSLLRGFELELDKLLPDSKVYAADAFPKLSSACQLAKKSFCMPLLKSADYIKKLLELCILENISLVIPTIDTELEMLALSREAFLQHGINIVVSDFNLVKRCNDKRLTSKLFQDKSISTPTIYKRDNLKFPLFIKPYDGSSSSDLHIIINESEITSTLMNNSRLIFMEYLDQNIYEEYTIDLYYDKSSTLKCIIPRKRIEVRAGEVVKAVTKKNNIVPFLRQRLGNMLGARGCLTLQLFVNEASNEYYGIEINPRFGGGFPLSYHAGANFPNWIIREYFLGEEIPYFKKWENNLLMLRFDQEVIVHESDCK